MQVSNLKLLTATCTTALQGFSHHVDATNGGELPAESNLQSQTRPVQQDNFDRAQTTGGAESTDHTFWHLIIPVHRMSMGPPSQMPLHRSYPEDEESNDTQDAVDFRRLLQKLQLKYEGDKLAVETAGRDVDTEYALCHLKFTIDWVIWHVNILEETGELPHHF